MYLPIIKDKLQPFWTIRVSKFSINLCLYELYNYFDVLLFPNKIIYLSKGLVQIFPNADFLNKFVTFGDVNISKVQYWISIHLYNRCTLGSFSDWLWLLCQHDILGPVNHSYICIINSTWYSRWVILSRTRIRLVGTYIIYHKL